MYIYIYRGTYVCIYIYIHTYTCNTYVYIQSHYYRATLRAPDWGRAGAPAPAPTPAPPLRSK